MERTVLSHRVVETLASHLADQINRYLGARQECVLIKVYPSTHGSVPAIYLLKAFLT